MRGPFLFRGRRGWTRKDAVWPPLAYHRLRPPKHGLRMDSRCRTRSLETSFHMKPMAKRKPKDQPKELGRPTLYKPEFIKQAAKLCELGATDAEIADFLGVTVRTFHRWKHEHTDFCHSLTVAKEAADNRVERSLYNRAVGYTFASEKIITVARGNNMGSEVERVKIKEHVPPDVTAQIFWLKNRRKDQWRDRIDNTHAGPDGGPIETADMTPRELAQRAVFLVAKAAKAKK